MGGNAGMQVRSRQGWTRWLIVVAVLVLVLQAGCASLPATDALPSWNAGPVKAAIVKVVEESVREGATGYVPPAERIAVFDNDGTLWTEHPIYVEVVFTFDRIRALAPQHPEWRTQMPFSAIVNNDRAAMAKLSEADFFLLAGTAHEGLGPDDYRKLIAQWLATSRHPRFGRPYTDLVYQPMLEVLAYLRANGYKTYIVSGGTIDFIRSFAERAHGIPPEQVIGTNFEAAFSFDNDVARLAIGPKVALLNDGPGKAVGIDRNIGRVPILAFGNSDGDIAMMQTTTHSPQSKTRPRFAAFVWHTDAAREYAYDRESSVGRLNRGLDLAPQLGWYLIDMKKDWKVIFP